MDKFKVNSNYDDEIKRVKRKSTIVFILVVSLFILLIFGSGIAFLKSIFSPSLELINETVSNDGKYKVEVYLVNGGATVDSAIRCYLKVDNRLGKKMIYNDYHINSVTISWEDDDTININGHAIDLPDGKYDFRYD